jgi:hypothetical protein
MDYFIGKPFKEGKMYGQKIGSISGGKKEAATTYAFKKSHFSSEKKMRGYKQVTEEQWKSL